MYMEAIVVLTYAGLPLSPQPVPIFTCGIGETLYFEAYSIFPKNKMQCSNARDQNWTA